MPVDPDSFETLLRAVEKDYSEVVRDGDSYDDPERYSTKSFAMDRMLGGGFPKGGFIRFFGPWSSAKTLCAYNLAASAQEAGDRVVYYDVEKQWDELQAKRAGVDTSILKIIRTTRIEEVGEIAETLMGGAHVHIFDSASGASSIDALKADVKDWQRGLKARAWNKVFERLKDKFDESENTIVYTDQVRINQNTGAEEPPGGKQMEHASDMTIQFKRRSWLYYDNNGYLTAKAPTGEAIDTYSGEKEPDGYEVMARCVKSRVCRPNRTALVRVDYDSMAFDLWFELERAAIHTGIATKSDRGGWIKLPMGKGKKDKSFNGSGQFREYLKDDEQLQEDIIAELFAEES